MHTKTVYKHTNQINYPFHRTLNLHLSLTLNKRYKGYYIVYCTIISSFENLVCEQAIIHVDHFKDDNYNDNDKYIVLKIILNMKE